MARTKPRPSASRRLDSRSFNKEAGVANRFVRLIRSGEIGTVAELKSLFKRLAKETHPDLAQTPSPTAAGQRAAAADFIRVREEYEHVLGDFDRYRFGAGRRERLVLNRRALYLSLESLFARGFPKIPRHAKEKERYDYARFAFLENMRVGDPERGESVFREFERELFWLRAAHPDDFVSLKSWIARLLDYHRSGIAALVVELKLGAESFASRFPENAGLAGFLAALADDLDRGPAARAAKGEKDARQS